MSHPDAESDWRPTASLIQLQRRALLLAGVRDFFRHRGYWEVETPLLSRDIVVDAHLDPFFVPAGECPAGDSGHGSAGYYLQTSPEFAMKRLLAAGAEAIFQVTRGFRQGESGRLHNPEFTIIEWYRTGDDVSAQMDFVEELVRGVFRHGAELRDLTPTGLPTDQPFGRYTYDSAFDLACGTPVLSLTASELAGLAHDHGITPPPGLAVDDRDGWLNLLLAECVEPHLGTPAPAFLFDYPASQAALAKVRPGDPPVAERFELYISGIELCNGYHELLDPDELRRRNRDQSAIRAREGCRPLPEESRLLAAMEAGLPACAGVALGFDRLAMLALGETSLASVVAFPWDRA